MRQFSSVLRNPLVAHGSELRRSAFDARANERGTRGDGDDDGEGIPPHMEQR